MINDYYYFRWKYEVIKKQMYMVLQTQTKIFIYAKDAAMQLQVCVITIINHFLFKDCLMN